MPVNTTHPDYDSASPAWSRARAVLAGEDAVKAAGKAFLSPLLDQTPEEYAAYSQRASFFNATARTAESYLGLIFRRPPIIQVGTGSTRSPYSSSSSSRPSTINHQLSAAFAAFTADADLLDTTLAAYARNIVSEVIGVGRAGTLIDWQPDERRATVSFYPAENIINWRVERVNGRNLPTLIVLRETATRHESLSNPDIPADEFVEDTVEQLRVLKLVDARSLTADSPGPRKPSTNPQRVYIVELYQPRPRPRSSDSLNPQPSTLNQPEWQLVHTDTPRRLGKPLPLIPFIFHGPSHSRPAIERTPLTDIITTNLHHYRLSADYNHGLHYTALPTPWISGFTRSTQLRIGSSTAWVAELPGASAGYLEFKGQGLSTFHYAMEQAERHLAVLGSRMLEDVKKVGETATAIELRQSGEHSVFSGIATSLSESLTQVLRWVYWWSSVEATPDAIPKGEVLLTLNTDFSAKGMSSQELQAVLAAWQSGAISQDSMFDLLRKGEIIPDDRTNEEEAKLIDTQTPVGTGSAKPNLVGTGSTRSPYSSRPSTTPASPSSFGPSTLNHQPSTTSKAPT